MVSKYFKAIALTLVILAIGLVAINYLDNERAANIGKTVERGSLDLQASQQLFLYESVFPNEDVCPAIESAIELQKVRAGAILSDIKASETNRLFPDSGLLKEKFLLQNVELYLLVEKSIKECGSEGIKPVIYFYPDKYYCVECATQAVILDSLVGKCSEARVFAFPTDLGVPVIGLLVKKYGISKYPTLVINGEKYEGVVSQAILSQKLGC